MATHSLIPAWRIPQTEEPGGLPSMFLKRMSNRDYLWPSKPEHIYLLASYEKGLLTPIQP